MYRLLCALLTAAMLLTPICVAEATSSEVATPAELGEGEILLQAYVNSVGDYYIGVPTDWAFVGYELLQLGMTDKAIENGMDEYTLALLKETITPENDILYAFSKRGEMLIVNYGHSEGADTENLIARMDDFKKALSEQYAGLAFTDECGEHKINDLTSVLMLCANYQGNAIRQYHMILVDRHYMFTFINVDKQTVDITLQNFGRPQREE